MKYISYCQAMSALTNVDMSLKFENKNGIF